MLVVSVPLVPLHVKLSKSGTTLGSGVWQNCAVVGRKPNRAPPTPSCSVSRLTDQRAGSRAPLRLAGAGGPSAAKSSQKAALGRKQVDMSIPNAGGAGS